MGIPTQVSPCQSDQLIFPATRTSSRSDVAYRRLEATSHTWAAHRLVINCRHTTKTITPFKKSLPPVQNLLSTDLKHAQMLATDKTKKTVSKVLHTLVGKSL